MTSVKVPTMVERAHTAKVILSKFNPEETNNIRKLIEADYAVFDKRRSTYTQNVIRLVTNHNPNVSFKATVKGSHKHNLKKPTSYYEYTKDCNNALDTLVSDTTTGFEGKTSAVRGYKTCKKCKQSMAPILKQVRSADEGMDIVGWMCGCKS
jgi:hypothetical protein